MLFSHLSFVSRKFSSHQVRFVSVVPVAVFFRQSVDLSLPIPYIVVTAPRGLYQWKNNKNENPPLCVRTNGKRNKHFYKARMMLPASYHELL